MSAWALFDLGELREVSAASSSGELGGLYSFHLGDILFSVGCVGG